MSAYADSSLLLSVLLGDARSGLAATELRRTGGCWWTPWQKVEAANALRALVARGHLAPADLLGIERHLRAMVNAGELRAIDLPDGALWAEAERLSAKHTATLGVRTLDLLHVAAARVLGARTFLTVDTRQHGLALAAGLTVPLFPPR